MNRMKPIIFSAPMVQAILDGRKTQMRRVMKPQPDRFFEVCDMPGDFHLYDAEWGLGSIYPKYQAGDILWVRETWRIGAWNEDIGCIAVDYKADNYARREWIRIKDEERFERYWIESTDDAIKAGIKPDANGEYHWEPGQAPTRWRPSIFMPREAARIFLRVKNVRVERVQDITVDDCRLEGCCCSDCLQTGPHSPDCKCDTLFYNVWNDINAKRGYGWDTNPYVWVYEFERVEGLKC